MRCCIARVEVSIRGGVPSRERSAHDEPDKLATHCFRQRSRNRSLSNSGGTMQEQYRSLVGWGSGLLGSRSRNGRRSHRRIAEDERSFGRGFGRGRDWSRRRRLESGFVRSQCEIGLPLLLLQSQNREPFEQALFDLVCARFRPEDDPSVPALRIRDWERVGEGKRSARAPSP